VLPPQPLVLLQVLLVRMSLQQALQRPVQLLPLRSSHIMVLPLLMRKHHVRQISSFPTMLKVSGSRVLELLATPIRTLTMTLALTLTLTLALALTLALTLTLTLALALALTLTLTLTLTLALALAQGVR
jgi:hypothetical protein